jgi:hypothetical protein
MKGPICPHCRKEYEIEDGCSAAQLVTYHGESPPVELECPSCDKTFWAKEIVLRSYESLLGPNPEQWVS